MSSKLETFPNQYPGREYEITIECPEFTAVCPKTGQPDFGIIHICYVPDQKIIELKSLKLYMVSFRDEGIFHEHVTNRILDDIVVAVEPVRCEVRGDFNLRGGIKTVVRANFEREKTEDRNQKSGEARLARGESPR
ncbi:MAG: preQ(1) synthase [Acidobacteriota bacterium]|nr:preQ(1) synthase [Acidobacteriota bacterium]